MSGAAPDVDGVPLDVAVALLRHMVRSRVTEDRLRALYQQSRLRGRLISGRGQEAIPVGATSALRPGDVVAPVHRDLGAHLVHGTAVVDVLRHYFGRATGPSRGRDGDIHMGEWRRGVFPMVSHLPDSWPIAVGIGLAFSLREEQRVTMAFCGDGATSNGTWHEAVNFASVFSTPTVLVVENNQYAYSTPTRRQFRVERVADRAAAYGVPAETVDGNDALAVHRAAVDAVERARTGGGPTLIEAMTMRMDGHAIHDAAAYVPPDLLASWRARDPIDRLGRRLTDAGLPRSEIDQLWAEARAEVAAAVETAEAEPLPDPAHLLDGVYAPS